MASRVIRGETVADIAESFMVTRRSVLDALYEFRTMYGNEPDYTYVDALRNWALDSEGPEGRVA